MYKSLVFGDKFLDQGLHLKSHAHEDLCVGSPEVRKPAPQNVRKYYFLSEVLCLNGQIHTKIQYPSW